MAWACKIIFHSCFAVIPQPVYMNAEELEKLRKEENSKNGGEDDLADDDLKTPTIEELSFPGQRLVHEDGSSSSSGSSSGYGSQNAIKIEDNKNGKIFCLVVCNACLCCFLFAHTCFYVGLPSALRINDCCTSITNPVPSLSTTTSNNLHFSKFNFNERPSSITCLRRPSFTLQSPLQHRPIVENIISDSNTYRIQDNTPNNRRSFALKRSDSYSPGRVFLNLFQNIGIPLDTGSINFIETRLHSL